MELLKIVKGECEQLGDAVFGACSVDNALLENYRKNMENILPGAQSVIVIAATHSHSALRSANNQVKQYDTLYTYDRVRHLAMGLVRELEAAGCGAVAVPAFIPIDMLGKGKGMRGEICWRTAGVAAGLGFIGQNNLLVTRAFGAGVRLGGVITTYSHKESPQDTEALSCSKCGACLENCPAGALSPYSVDKKKCGDYIFAYGLRRFTSFLDELLAAKDGERSELLESGTARELWQNFMSGCYYYCWECQASCPKN